jgi:PAS domain S-box-containing protein
VARFWQINPSVKQSLSRQAIFMVVLPLLVQLVFFVVLWGLLREIDQERAREVHAREMTAHVNALMRVIAKRTTATISHHISDSPEQQAQTAKFTQQALSEMSELSDLSRNNPNEHAVVTRISAIVDSTQVDMRQAQSLFNAGDRMGAAKIMLRLQNALSQVLALTDQIVDEQQQIQIERKDAQARLRDTVQIAIAIGILLDVLLAVLLAYSFNKRTTERLGVLLDNTLKLAANEALLPKLKGSDEIAHLDHVFHRVYDALQDAGRKERAIVENVLAVICSLDDKGRFTAVNAAATSIWGWSPEDLVGKRLVSIVFPDDSAMTAAKLDKIAQSEEKGILENRVVRKDKAICETHWALYWSQSEKTMFCVAQDVSERKRIDRLKRDFVAMVSHDLKTPLTSIQMVHSLLKAEAYGELNDDGHASLDIADEEVDRLIRLVSELLDIEAMESGELDLFKETMSANSLVTAAIQSVSQPARAKKINIVKSLGETASVQADKDRIVQVLINFLSNAIKFSPAEERIWIKVELVDSQIQFSVTDHGRGVPKDMQEAVFDRFKQVETADAKKLGGTGLGLAICKAIVDRHGGTIGVESEPGHGSTFWFRLPAETNKIAGDYVKESSPV